MAKTVIVMKGDQTGQELLEEALRVLAPEVIGFEVMLETYDLSLENRRKTKNKVVYEAAQAMKQAGFGIKAATITPEEKGDVGSPNAILRAEIDGKVIVRTGRRIPGIVPLAGLHAPISVVRMAVGDAYGAKEWREGEGLEEVAYRTETIDRRTCRAVAEYAFQQAKRMPKCSADPNRLSARSTKACSRKKWTPPSQRHPEVEYEPQLIDATYALLVSSGGEPLVIPALNRDGDCLSDLVLQLFGSIAGAESLLLSLDDELKTRVVMAEAPHGTAPSLYGKTSPTPWP